MGIKKSAMEQFGRQAEAYSKGSIFPDQEHLSEIVRRSGVEKGNRVLDIATGAGFLALEFARYADSVVGTDITGTMLDYAKANQRNSGHDNIGFLRSDVESLPFPDGTFDIVSCRFAFHHFPDPQKALREMKRVCRGRIVLIDGTSSKEPIKSLYHNRIEKLRDPSHVRIYQLDEMKTMFHAIGAVVREINHWDIPQDFQEWMRRAGTGMEAARVIEELIKASVPEDRTGLRVKLEEGNLKFTYDTVILIAETRH